MRCKEVENQSFRTFETYLIATMVYLACSLVHHGRRRLAAGARRPWRERGEP